MKYALKSQSALRYLMGSPGRGAPYTIRELAEASGVSRATIDRLRTGRQGSVNVADAHALVEALGVAVLVLFAPPSSPNSTKEDLARNGANREGVDPWDDVHRLSA